MIFHQEPVNKIDRKYLDAEFSVIYKEMDVQKNSRLRDERESVRMVTRNPTISIREIQHALLQAVIEASTMIIQRVLKDTGFLF